MFIMILLALMVIVITDTVASLMQAPELILAARITEVVMLAVIAYMFIA